MALVALAAAGINVARAVQKTRTPESSLSLVAAPESSNRSMGIPDTAEARPVTLNTQVAREAELDSAEPQPSVTTPAPALRPSPSIANGRTELGDGLFAVRDGASVTVHFDVANTRTRRRDKFERVVRATLPRVYGAVADSLLAEIPAGKLVAEGELVTELATRGVPLPSAGEWQLVLLPKARPAPGGPLVVAYEAALTR